MRRFASSAESPLLHWLLPLKNIDRVCRSKRCSNTRRPGALRIRPTRSAWTARGSPPLSRAMNGLGARLCRRPTAACKAVRKFSEQRACRGWTGRHSRAPKADFEDTSPRFCRQPDSWVVCCFHGENEKFKFVRLGTGRRARTSDPIARSAAPLAQNLAGIRAGQLRGELRKDRLAVSISASAHERPVVRVADARDAAPRRDGRNARRQGTADRDRRGSAGESNQNIAGANRRRRGFFPALR